MKVFNVYISPVYIVIRTEIHKNISPIIIMSILLIASANKYKEIVNNCKVVFIFAIKVTLVKLLLPFLALKSLRAPTHISLAIIIDPKKPIK